MAREFGRVRGRRAETDGPAVGPAVRTCLAVRLSFSSGAGAPPATLWRMRTTMNNAFRALYSNTCFLLFVVVVGSAVYKLLKMAGAV
jgi:hypothetical protein